LAFFQLLLHSLCEHFKFFFRPAQLIQQFLVHLTPFQFLLKTLQGQARRACGIVNLSIARLYRGIHGPCGTITRLTSIIFVAAIFTATGFGGSTRIFPGQLWSVLWPFLVRCRLRFPGRIFVRCSTRLNASRGPWRPDSSLTSAAGLLATTRLLVARLLRPTLAAPGFLTA
jgi:hypothetical protein